MSDTSSDTSTLKPVKRREDVKQRREAFTLKMFDELNKLCLEIFDWKINAKSEEEAGQLSNSIKDTYMRLEELHKEEKELWSSSRQDVLPQLIQPLKALELAQRSFEDGWEHLKEVKVVTRQLFQKCYKKSTGNFISNTWGYRCGILPSERGLTNINKDYPFEYNAIIAAFSSIPSLRNYASPSYIIFYYYDNLKEFEPMSKHLTILTGWPWTVAEVQETWKAAIDKIGEDIGAYLPTVGYVICTCRNKQPHAPQLCPKN